MTKILIVEARFYTDIADALVRGASDVLSTAGVEFDRQAVPGALEIPPAIAMAISAGKKGRVPAYTGYIALGCVIRGETSHYDIVCNESARGLMSLAVEHTLPLANGILTCENREQALARARPEDKNKGGAVAQACLDMIALRKTFGLSD